MKSPKKVAHIVVFSKINHKIKNISGIIGVMLLKLNAILLFEGLSKTVKPVLSGPYIKRTPSIKRRQEQVPFFVPHIYCKKNLYSMGTSIKRTRTLDLTFIVISIVKNLY